MALPRVPAGPRRCCPVGPTLAPAALGNVGPVFQQAQTLPQLMLDTSVCHSQLLLLKLYPDHRRQSSLPRSHHTPPS